MIRGCPLSCQNFGAGVALPACQPTSAQQRSSYLTFLGPCGRTGVSAVKDSCGPPDSVLSDSVLLDEFGEPRFVALLDARPLIRRSSILPNKGPAKSLHSDSRVATGDSLDRGKLQSTVPLVTPML